MKAIIIFGPAAVGKMSVGIELQSLTDYKLFHNHMVIELVYNFYKYGDPQFWDIVGDFRNRLFSEFSKSNFPGIILTYVWALDQESDHNALLEYIYKLGISIDDVLFVELEADQDIRLQRNKSELRLREKKSKNNTNESEKFIIESEKTFKLNTSNDFFYPNQHIKINNSAIEPSIVAQLILNEMKKRNWNCSIDLV